jgi:peptide/nickel transport system substrate-binding protein
MLLELVDGVPELFVSIHGGAGQVTPSTPLRQRTASPLVWHIVTWSSRNAVASRERTMPTIFHRDRAASPLVPLAGCVLALSAVAGCGRKPAERTLAVVGRSPIASLDPLANADYYAQNVFRNVFDPLVAVDAELRIVPALAVSWSNPSENLWQFELRPDVHFHDGRPLTASDVMASIERARRETPAAMELEHVSAVRAPSPRLVEIETTFPVPLLLNRLARVLVLPGGEAGAGLPVGTGPYRFRAFSAGREVVLEGVDDGWHGPPRWDRVTFGADPDGRARVERLLRGEADIVEAPPLEDTPRIQASGRATLVEATAAQVAVLGLNAQRQPGNPFARVEARRAVSLALDREALVREALGGSGEPASQLAAPGIVGFVPDLSPASPDPAAARALVAAAGLRHGIQSSLHFSERDRLLAEAVARQAAAAGVEFRLEELTWQELDRRLRERASPAHIYLVTFPSGDVAELLLDLHTPSADSRFGAYNFSGYSDPALDDLVERADLAMKPRERIELLETAQRRATEAYALIPLVVPRQRFAVRRHIAWNGHPLGRVDLQAVGLH